MSKCVTVIDFDALIDFKKICKHILERQISVEFVSVNNRLNHFKTASFYLSIEITA